MVSFTVIIMRSFITLIILALIDIYAYQAIKTMSRSWNQAILQKSVRWGYWFITIGFYAFMVLMMAQIFGKTPKITGPNSTLFQYAFGSLIALYVPKLVLIVVLFSEDIVRLLRWAAQKVTSAPKTATKNTPITEGLSLDLIPEVNNSPLATEPITRSEFLSQAGVVAAAIPFIGVMHGIVKGRYNYTIHEHTVYSPTLPDGFDGFRFAQLSDIHSGSFDAKKPVQEGIAMLNDQGVEVVLFTGDIVNNVATELEPWVAVFDKISAPMGVYSVMGNHDYGDYVPWKTPEDRARNIARLHYLQNEMGWKMLIDANTKLQRKGDSIALIGVENWGKGFKEYGNLTKAAAGSESAAFKILMSHDPTHWEQIVKDFPHKIDLTLSGHTHGMQFGIEAGDFRWSPVSFRYPHWAGLYHEQDLYLHVNRGFGYIGFPGRVGIYPEITIITLRKGEKHV